MTPENWTPLLRALEPYPALRARMAVPGLTPEQRVALLRQAGFDVSTQELLRWRTAPDAALAGAQSGEALPDTALDAMAGAGPNTGWGAGQLGRWRSS
ncbi:Nif11-like leader peptide family natural product precursor [Pseudoroseomonas cervicalis]|nr:Nif11-like leader peptide family natural product precursor [Pseudoroseomonas cervicalis]